MLTFQFEECPLCGEKSIAPLQGYEAHQLYRCPACDFVFCRRKPSTNDLKSHYSAYPRAQPISSITMKRYDELLSRFEKFRHTNNLIDVGCGDGHFLLAAKKRNWNVFGTEFSEEAVNNCCSKGIHMTTSPLDPNQYQNLSFDVITSFEVIEHLNTPLQEVDAYKKILRPGGVVYITTPNFNSISRNILKSKWNVIEYPEHLSYFTRGSLRRLFSKDSFKLLAMSTTGVSLTRLSVGYAPYRGRSSSQQFDERFRQKSENGILKFAKNWSNGLLNFAHKGDAMKALFQKI
jgi:2-polyprenyl-3-methyl-5-hydroxy-6-metoxy-1,4-benzoquinol methylase